MNRVEPKTVGESLITRNRMTVNEFIKKCSVQKRERRRRRRCRNRKLPLFGVLFAVPLHGNTAIEERFASNAPALSMWVRLYFKRCGREWMVDVEWNSVAL